MRYQQMGKTGLFVSELCLGTMTFGGKDSGGSLSVAIRSPTMRAMTSSGWLSYLLDDLAARAVLAGAHRHHAREHQHDPSQLHAASILAAVRALGTGLIVVGSCTWVAGYASRTVRTFVSSASGVIGFATKATSSSRTP